jgi:hypothetical protein
MLGRLQQGNRLRAALLALALGAAAVGACTREHDCRPGTLFLQVDFAPYTNVERVYVEVMVAGAATRAMSFDVRPPATGGGGIQVNFDTYPAGKHADVVVRLEGASGTLATRSLAVELTGECLAADVRFGAADGGAGGRGGTAGGSGGAAGTSAGGASGSGGVAGTGAGGVAGTGVAGAGGRGGNASGGSGGAAGTGTGGGTAGVGGGAGTGVAGAGGRGGAGGSAGTGVAGASGRGGAGGGVAGASGRGGSASGGSGGCAATAENCFNYLDDDCDGNIDCMDTDCNAVALCVALDPGQGQLGVILSDPQAPCPANYTTATTINRGQIDARCSSTCGCTPPATSCVAPFYDYPTYPACMADASAQMVGSSSTSFSCTPPNWHADANGYVFGVGVGTITPSYAGCTATGTSTPTTPTWTATNRFCATALRGGGCGNGSVCLPAITNNQQRCVLATGGAACPAGTQRGDWWTGYTGTFSCNPCSCDQPSGASCADVRLAVATSSSCDAASRVASLASGEHMCAAPNTLYRPSIVMTGAPTIPTCTPQATSSGALTPSGQQTTCCR